MLILKQLYTARVFNVSHGDRIGRSPECQQHAPSYRDISRFHASFTLDRGMWRITDLDSLNGTRVVSGADTIELSKDESTLLLPGDLIHLGGSFSLEVLGGDD